MGGQHGLGDGGHPAPSRSKKMKRVGRAVTVKLKGRSTFPESLFCDGLPNTATASGTLAGLVAGHLKGGRADTLNLRAVPWEKALGADGSRSPGLVGTLLCSSSVDLGQQASCTHGPWSMEESPSYGLQTMRGNRAWQAPGRGLERAWLLLSRGRLCLYSRTCPPTQVFLHPCCLSPGLWHGELPQSF